MAKISIILLIGGYPPIITYGRVLKERCGSMKPAGASLCIYEIESNTPVYPNGINYVNTHSFFGKYWSRSKLFGGGG